MLELEEEEEDFLGGLSHFLCEPSKIPPVKFSIRVVQVVSRRKSTKVRSCH